MLAELRVRMTDRSVVSGDPNKTIVKADAHDPRTAAIDEDVRLEKNRNHVHKPKETPAPPSSTDCIRRNSRLDFLLSSSHALFPKTGNRKMAYETLKIAPGTFF